LMLQVQWVSSDQELIIYDSTTADSSNSIGTQLLLSAHAHIAGTIKKPTLVQEQLDSRI